MAIRRPRSRKVLPTPPSNREQVAEFLYYMGNKVVCSAQTARLVKIAHPANEGQAKHRAGGKCRILRDEGGLGRKPEAWAGCLEAGFGDRCLGQAGPAVRPGGVLLGVPSNNLVQTEIRLKSLILSRAVANLPGPCLLFSFPRWSASDRGFELGQHCSWKTLPCATNR